MAVLVEAVAGVVALAVLVDVSILFGAGDVVLAVFTLLALAVLVESLKPRGVTGITGVVALAVFVELLVPFGVWEMAVLVDEDFAVFVES